MMTAPVSLILVPLILEAALRALIAAIAVWVGLRLLSVGNVLVQKAAWGLVLVAALAMPLVPHWQGLPALASFRLPAIPQLANPASQPALPGTSALLGAPAVTRTVAAPAAALAQAPLDQTPMSTAAPRQMRVEPQSIIPQTAPGAADRYPAPAISNSEFDAHAQPMPDPAPSANLQLSTPQPAASKPVPAPIRIAALGWLCYLGVFAALLLRLVFRAGIGASRLDDGRANRRPARLRGGPAPAFQSPRCLARQHRFRHRSTRRLRRLG